MEGNPKLLEFIRHVGDMRNAQKLYDKWHNEFSRKEKKYLESLVDKRLAEFQAVNAQKQGELI